MTDWEMKVHNFMCLNKFVKKGEIVFTGSSLCELFPINEMLQNVDHRLHRSMYSYVRLSIDRCTATYV